MIGRVLRAEWRFRRGQKLAAQGRFDEAIEAFIQAQGLRPRAAGISLHHALALAETARLPEAVHAFQQAIALQPTNPVLPMFLGRLYFDYADYPQASKWCAHALSLSPYNCHALALQALIELARGQVALGSQRLQQPVPLPLSLLERGLLWLVRRRVPTLLQQANAALQGRILLQVETLLQQQATPVRTLAQQLLETSAATHRETFADHLLGGIDWCLTRVILGIRRLYIALRYAFHPASRAMHLRFVQAEDAAARGQAATAQALYTQVAQQNPDMPSIQARLCEVCYAQGKFPEALRHLRHFLKQLPDTDPPSTEQSLFLGELLCQVGQYQDADTVLAQVGTRTVPDYRLWYYLGLCQLQAGATRAAQRSFIQAMQQLNPDIAALRLAEMSRLNLPK